VSLLCVPAVLVLCVRPRWVRLHGVLVVIIPVPTLVPTAFICALSVHPQPCPHLHLVVVVACRFVMVVVVVVIYEQVKKIKKLKN